jgi:hypothetical protein
MTRTNTLAYHENLTSTSIKSFITLGPGLAVTLLEFRPKGDSVVPVLGNASMASMSPEGLTGGASISRASSSLFKRCCK